MQPGILLIAVDAFGEGFYYHLAYNMALSIKLDSPDTPIAVLTDDVNMSHLTEKQKSIFDIKIPVQEEDYFEDFLMNPFLLKTNIYKYSPFETTLYLDVDGLFMFGYKHLSDLFDRLKDVPFQIHEVRRYTKDQRSESGMIWTKPKENEPNHFASLWEVYGLKDDSVYPEYNSSFIWFKKTPENEFYFNGVKTNYFNRKVAFKALGKSYPDEMAWNITSAQMNHMGAIDGFKPCFFEWEHTDKEFENIARTSYFMMMAGGFQISKLVSFYDNLIKTIRFAGADPQPFRFDMKKKIFFRK